MKITHLSLIDYVYKFRDGPYVMSHITQVDLPVRLVRLEFADGRMGWGEVVRKGFYNDLAPQKEDQVVTSLQGASENALEEVVVDLRRQGPEMRGLAFGLETAMLDATARQLRCPLYKMLGGLRQEILDEYYGPTAMSVDELETLLSTSPRLWRVFQLKLGVDSLKSDIERIEIAMKYASQEQIVLADFNGGLTRERAIETVVQFDDPRLIWEEPCKVLDDNLEVIERTGKAVMLDQCMDGLPAFMQALESDLPHSLAIKPAFLGGLVPARTARDLCMECGMRVRVDGPWCGSVAAAAVVSLACGTPKDSLVASCDLRQPLLIEENWGDIRRSAPWRIGPSPDFGHGIQPTFT
ncbi:MAG: mandelate racemase/muconate lactonizing enzyme family protein [Pseudomonadota bacterium]